jgi:hypothetical protein
MSTEQDDSKTQSEWVLLEKKLLAAFREAKAHGLTWRDCEAVAYEALNETFPDADIEMERKAALGF